MAAGDSSLLRRIFLRDFDDHERVYSAICVSRGAPTMRSWKADHPSTRITSRGTKPSECCLRFWNFTSDYFGSVFSTA